MFPQVAEDRTLSGESGTILPNRLPDPIDLGDGWYYFTKRFEENGDVKFSMHPQC